MICSIKTLSSDNPFKVVYFDLDGTILSFENRVDKNNKNNFAYFSAADLLRFLDGTYVTNGYNVVFKKDEMHYVIVRRDAGKYIVKNNASNNILHIDYHSSPDLKIYVTDNGFDILATSNLEEFFVEQNNDKDIIIKNNKSHKFYITMKNESGLLIDTIELDYSKILTGKKQTIKYEHKYKNISIYADYIFTTYSMEDIRE
jgi:Fe-S cluster assembly iron-binding protein IscA